MSTGPMLRLTVDETWYDASGGLVTGGKGIDQRAAPAGRESARSKIETPFNAEDEGEQLQLHARQRHGQAAQGGEADGDWRQEPATKPAAKKASATKKKELEAGP